MGSRGALGRKRPTGKLQAEALEEKIKDETGSVDQKEINNMERQIRFAAPTEEKLENPKTQRLRKEKGVGRVFGPSGYDKGDKQSALVSNKNRRRIKMLADCLEGVTMQDLTDNIIDYFWDEYSDQIKEITEL